MRLQDTKNVKAMIDRMNAQSGDYNNLTNKPTINGVEVDGTLTSADLGLAAAQEDIVLEGNATWLSGTQVVFEDEDDIAALNHYKELVLAGAHPRFGFTASYMGVDCTIVKEPDDIMADSSTFTAFFSAYLGSGFGFYGIVLAYSADTWTLEAVSLISPQ